MSVFLTQISFVFFLFRFKNYCTAQTFPRLVQSPELARPDVKEVFRSDEFVEKKLLFFFLILRRLSIIRVKLHKL